jgi:hypothetical protein
VPCAGVGALSEEDLCEGIGRQQSRCQGLGDGWRKHCKLDRQAGSCRWRKPVRLPAGWSPAGLIRKYFTIELVPILKDRSFGACPLLAPASPRRGTGDIPAMRGIELNGFRSATFCAVAGAGRLGKRFMRPEVLRVSARNAYISLHILSEPRSHPAARNRASWQLKK